MNKLTMNFIKTQYRSAVENYVRLTKTLGLWKSERYVFSTYLKKTDNILDLGCGSGRTTFPLVQEGYNKVVGVDFVPEMIKAARQLNHYFKTNIMFEEGDACSLRFKNRQFDAVIFSFTGLMSIPQQVNRDLALTEINRVLKPGGIFIFTTYDREREEEYFSFWKEEKERWANNKQSNQLFQFGDIISPSKNEEEEIYIHIPNQEEIQSWLIAHHFEVIETFYRSDNFEEYEAVKSSSGECRFWVASKCDEPSN